MTMCQTCTATFDALTAAGIEYEVVEPCAFCGVRPADTDGCCSEACRYQLVREGWAHPDW